MSDEEEEGVVCDEGGGTYGAAQHHDGRRGCSRLRALLVHLHEGFVVNLGQVQVVGGGHACRRTGGQRKTGGR